MQSTNNFLIVNNSINPLFTEHNSILNILNHLLSIANPNLENYDKHYNEYNTVFLKENMNLILKVNKHLGLELSYYSPFTYIIYSHLLLNLYYIKQSDIIIAKYEIIKSYEVIDILTNIRNWFGEIFFNRIQLSYSRFNNAQATEFHKDFKELAQKMEYSLYLLKSEIDIKKPYLFDVNTKNNPDEVDILYQIKTLPDSIIYIIKNINNESYQSIFNEYKDLVNFINNSHANTIAELFFKMLKSNKFYLYNINKSKSIRQFLNHFEIEKLPAEKIVKAMSNLNEDSIIITNSKIKNFENYFIKNEIKFQTFIEKK
jgi:hypothetical protein